MVEPVNDDSKGRKLDQYPDYNGDLNEGLVREKTESDGQSKRGVPCYAGTSQ